MQEFSPLDGALLVDKPPGPTSHDVVDAIRRRFGIKKVGHCGTLDPNATGLLIIVLGRATKLSERLMGDDKVYEGTIKFVGDQMQLPPMVSAIKKDGVPLYKLARKGIEIEREPRLVHIYNFRFTTCQPPLAEFCVACTKGTYIRSLANDLGEKLGCGAHLTALRRTASGRFDVADALKLEAILKLPVTELEKRVLPYLRLAANA